MTDAARTVHCPRCTAIVADDAAFCAHCGAALYRPVAGDSADAALDEYARAEVESISEELRAALAPRYELLDLLGMGGMAFVFRAREESLRRLVAVKVLSPRLAEVVAARMRFTREARAVAALSHPNVIGVYGVGVTQKLALPYIVMQYVDGPTLASLTESRRRSDERKARRIVGEIAAALGAAHAHNIVHRDVKPGNVLIEGRTGRAIVVDFGISALLGGGEEGSPDAPRVTTTGSILGTPVYMSPEQAAGERVSAASDVYSLGMIAYELFAGVLPFKATSAMGWAAAHMRDIPDPVATRSPELPPDVTQLVDRCLSKDPIARPLAQEVAAVMSPSIETEIHWPPPGLQPLLGRGRAMGRLAALLAVAVILISACLAFPPSLVRADVGWWTRYADAQDVAGSALGVVSEGTAPTSSLRVWGWRAALVGGFAVAVGTGILLVIVGTRAASRAVRARGLGCEWGTIADVLSDPDGRNGLLIAGAREMAAIDASRRDDALLARRGAVVARLVAGAWVVFALSAWALVAALELLRLDGSGPLMAWPVFLFISAPALMGLGLSAVDAVRERRALMPLPRRRPHATTMSVSEKARRDGELTAWYASMPQGRRSGSGPAMAAMSPRAVYTAAATLTALAFAGAAAVALTIAANLVAARNLERFGPETAHLVANARRLRETVPLREARGAWSRYVPPAVPAADSIARAALRLLANRRSSGATLPDYAVPPDRLLGRDVANSPRGGASEAVRQAANGLPPDSAVQFDVAARHQRTELVRRLSSADADLFSAVLDRPLAEYESMAAVPELPYAQLRAGATANALGAVAAVARSDFVEAERRLGENAALAEKFLRVPRRFAGAFGAGMLQDLALLPLAQMEELRGESARAVRLRRAADTVREMLLDPAWSSRLLGLAATPDDLAHFSAALRDPFLPSGLRGEGFESGLLGFCLNAREIVAGPSPLRAESVRLAADSVRDIPDAPGLAILATRTALSKVSPAGSEGSGGTLLTRVLFCLRMGRD